MRRPFDDDDVIGSIEPDPEDLPDYDDQELASLRTTNLHNLMRGVSVPALVQLFRMGRGKLVKMLLGCPPVRTGRNGAPYYDIAVAASYLVAPRMDMTEYMRTLKPDQLPEHLRPTYWDARLKEQRWRVNAAELWPTESVLRVLGETFQTVKNVSLLWGDTVEEMHGVTDEQRATIIRLRDQLLDKIHIKLVEQAKKGATPSQIDEEPEDDDV